MTKKSYVVTDQADEHTKIAGKRREVGATIELTPAEAEWEEKRGLIEAAAPEKPAKKT